MPQQERIDMTEIDHDIAERIEWVWKNYSIRPVSCTYFHNRDWSLERRQIWDTFFLFITKGCLEVQLDDQQFSVPAGHMLILPDGVYHQLSSARDQPELWQISLHAHINNSWGESLFTQTDTRHVKVQNAQYWNKTLGHSSALLRNTAETGRHIFQAQLQTLINELLLDGLEIDITHNSKDPRIEHAIQLINKDIAHDWTVEELADITQLGVVQFRKLFKLNNNITPKKYIHQQRIKESCQLLQYSRLKIKDIAERVGFQSDYYYQRSFKQAMGCRPTEFRQQNRV